MIEREKKTGLVFSGGGGKGAYEIGVWKALEEYGTDRMVGAVSGGSVGGLNGALFIHGDYFAAEKLWKSIDTDKILQLDLAEIAKKVVTALAVSPIPGMNKAKFLSNAAAWLKGKGWFTRDGLIRLIEESGVCPVLESSAIPFHVCVLNGNTGRLEYPRLNGKPKEEVSLWLLATSAIPGIFGSVDINGSEYYDGCVFPGKFGNATPYQPLIDEHGCTHIINVYLDRAPVMRKEQDGYQGVKFWNIVPAKEFEGMICSLNFSPENIEKLIKQGYRDTRKILEQFDEFLVEEENYAEKADELKASNKKFQEAIVQNKAVRSIPDAGDKERIVVEQSGESMLALNDGGKTQAIAQKTHELDEYGGQGVGKAAKMDLSALAETIERHERELIESGLDSVVEEMKENSALLLDEAFASISTLASTEGRIKGRMDQGFFSRITGAITGRNSKVQAEIDWDLNRAIYANQQLIQKLNRKHALSMEVLVSLNNKTNYLMSHVNMLYGSSAKTRQEFIDLLKLMCGSIAHAFDDANQKIAENTDRICRLEHRQSMDDWYHKTIDSCRNLSNRDKLLEATFSFYKSTGGDWDNSAMHRFRNAMRDVGLEEYRISPVELFAGDSDRFLSPHIEPSCVLPVAPEKENRFPTLKCMQIALENPGFSTDEIKRRCGESLGLDCSCPLPAEDVGLELLHSLKSNDKNRLPTASLAPRDLYCSALDKVVRICEQLDFDEKIKSDALYLKERIANFKIVVPITGKFSSGKSSLINKYLGGDFLRRDITPETAIATELAYADEERTTVHYLDGRQVEATESLKDIVVSDDMFFLRGFLNNLRLKNRRNTVLVDMPGFDSKKGMHNKAIARYLIRGDFFINLMPADAPFDNSVLVHLGEIHHTYDKRIGCLISKSGRKLPGQIGELQRELASLLEERGILCEKVGAIELDEAQNGSIKDFEDLVDSIARRGDELVASRYEDEIAVVLTKTGKRLAAIQKGALSEEVEIEQKKKEMEEAFRTLKVKVEDDLLQMKYNICTVGREALLNKARCALNENIDKLVRAAKCDSVNSALNSLLRPVLQQGATAIIDEETDRLQARLASHADSMSGDISVLINIPPQEKQLFSMEGASIGAALGFILLGPFGAVLGGILGNWIGSGDNDEGDARLRQAIENQVVPQAIPLVMEKIETSLASAVDRITQAVMSDFKAEEDNYRKQLDMIGKELREQRESFRKRQREYGQAIEEIGRFLEKVKACRPVQMET